MTGRTRSYGAGPLRARDLPEGVPYELSRGFLVVSSPSGRRHGRANVMGSLPLATDPRVSEVGVDVGFELDGGTLRAPDVAVGNVADVPGWGRGSPPLAVEYADVGTSEVDLRVKVRELLGTGAQQVWVVRLEGPRRVEVHRRGRRVGVKTVGEVLEAPGVLKNPVPVEAMFEQGAALDATLRNLLQRKGYDSLQAVLDEGHEKGVEEGEKKGRREGRREGEKKGLEQAMVTIFERRLTRRLRRAELTTLRARLGELGAERLTDVVLSSTVDELVAWLGDTSQGHEGSRR
jgi:hypothetical protein